MSDKMEPFELISDSKLYTASRASIINNENATTFLLGNDLYSDFTIHVDNGDITIPGHRLIIGTASAVLEAMVYGVGSLPAPKIMTVKEFAAKDFIEVLRFLYRREAKLTLKNVIRIQMIAHFYDLSMLEKYCMKFLRRKIREKDWVQIFNEAYLLKSEAMQLICLKVVGDKRFPFTDIKIVQLFDLMPAALEKVMQVKNLMENVDPMKMFKALLQWATKKQRAAVDDPPTLRELVNGHLKCVRFSVMDAKKFGDCLKLLPSGFFTTAEIAVTMSRISRPDEQPEEDATIALPFYKRTDIW